MSAHVAGGSRTRRRLLQAGGAIALVPWLPARAAADDLPDIPALGAYLAGRKPRLERVRLSCRNSPTTARRYR